MKTIPSRSTPDTLLQILQRTRRGYLASLALICVGLALTALGTLRAQDTATQTIFHTFHGTSDGALPNTLIQARDGNFYGTTNRGGSQNRGTFFRITPAGTLTTLYQFTGGDDGDFVNTGLIQAADGNFYGTTPEGGAPRDGTVFRITPEGVLTTLHTFSGPDGYVPTAGLVQGRDGNFYGTTQAGGSLSGGTVFRMTPSGELIVLHSFSQDNTTSAGNDGGLLVSGLVQGRDGNFYGTTSTGGSNSAGTFFRITPTGTFTNLTAFSSIFGGQYSSTLIQGSDGDFYGTFSGGGRDQGGGSVFRITPVGEFTGLHGFGSTGSGTIDPDTINTDSALVQGSDGAFYGTTELGGANRQGTVYRITADGTYGTIYQFTGNDGSRPGKATSLGIFPGAALVQATDGKFYGTTGAGGSDGAGVLYKLTVPPAFFGGAAALSNGVYYLAFANGNDFGYYSYPGGRGYIYHFDLGYEYIFDANDGVEGVYLYDFQSNGFFYTSPTYSFPYLYDFSENSVVYYFPDPAHPGRYNTNGTRYFYVFRTGQILSK